MLIRCEESQSYKVAVFGYWKPYKLITVHHGITRTLNSKPETLNSKPETLNPQAVERLAGPWLPNQCRRGINHGLAGKVLRSRFMGLGFRVCFWESGA